MPRLTRIIRIMRIVKIARTIRTTRKIRRILSHQNNYNHNTVTKYFAYLTVADDRHPQGVTKSFWWGPQRLASRRATDSASGATEKPGDFAVVADCLSWCEASSEMGVFGCETTVFFLRGKFIGSKDLEPLVLSIRIFIHAQGLNLMACLILDVIFKTHTWTVHQSTR